MKYILRIITLPFVWIYTIIGITMSYMQYGLACFTEDVYKQEKAQIENEVETYLN